MKTVLALIIAASSLSGCAWVKVTEAGSQVRIGTAAEVADCALVGKVSAKTRASLGIKRGERKVQHELYTLAMNEAAGLGADMIVPEGAPANGEQHFTAYNCAGSAEAGSDTD